MPEKLERSPQVDGKIESIRRMSPDPEDSVGDVEKSTKQEKAQELRMELQLETAKLMQGTLVELERHPRIEKDDLATILKEKFLTTHPEAVDRYLTNMVKARDQVKEARGAIRNSLDESDRSNRRVAQQIFKSLLVKELPPNVKLIDIDVRLDDSYPLGIAIEIDPKYFEYVDREKNVGGFYKGSAEIRLPSEGKNMFFPVMTVKGFNRDRVMEHERGHADNRPIKSTDVVLDEMEITRPSGAVENVIFTTPVT